MGQYLTSSHGLCNIGEWHSHHRVGLALPSSGDQDTVWQNMESVAGGRFLVFIANIRGSQNQPTVNVGSFMFVATSTEMRNSSLTSLPGSSPLRLSLNDKHFKRGTEPGVDWRNFSVAREQTGGTLSNTKPEDWSFVTDDTDKRFGKSDLNEINHDSAKNPNLVATRETKLLPRKGRVNKSYGTLDNELSGKVPLKSGVKDTTHESQRKSNEVVTGEQTKLLSRN